MEEEIPDDSFPYQKELENKVGRKTPESLLVWMRDAADSEDGWRSDVGDGGDRSSALSDSVSDKISNLKQEMRWLRSADVRILRQLVAVHEGIEAMRWLMEERDAFASRGSSLTGSLSSLVTVEEHGPSMSPCREILSQSEDLIETTAEESENHLPHADHCDSNHKSYFDTMSPETPEARPPSPSNFEVTCSTCYRHGQASSSPANGLVRANLPKSTPQDVYLAPLQDIKSGADVIRRALARSSRARREGRVDSQSEGPSGGAQKEHQAEESCRASQDSTTEDEKCDRETILLGYDAQWSWVESQDDVTFL